jgi:luciferase family oxidoreductase group 1
MADILTGTTAGKIELLANLKNYDSFIIVLKNFFYQNFRFGMKLSIVDLSAIQRNGSRHQAYMNTLEMAQKAEEWGFERIWLAEHHGTAALAGRAPEILIPFIAANTKKIKVGSGSVLLNHYSPFKVAEVFSTLEELFPGRIDMGIGRATTGPVSDLALQRNRSYRQTTDDSSEQLYELLCWMNDDFDEKHTFSRTKVYKDGSLPDFWLLGSSSWSASAAAQLGLRYSFAGFINPSQSYQITDNYRRFFKPSKAATGIEKPELILSLHVYCAETDEEAAKLSAPVQLMLKRLMMGDINSLPEDEETAVRLLGGLREPIQLQNPQQPPQILAGTPQKLKVWLSEISEAFGADEIMIQCLTANHSSRLKSHRLLAESFGMI